MKEMMATYLWCQTSSFLQTWESPTLEENQWMRQQLFPPPRRAAQQGKKLWPQIHTHTQLDLVPYCVGLIDLWNVELCCFGTDRANNYTATISTETTDNCNMELTANPSSGGSRVGGSAGQIRQDSKLRKLLWNLSSKWPQSEDFAGFLSLASACVKGLNTCD